MRICIFEDAGVDFLEPIALTRPAFDLWCGASTLLERQRRVTGAAEVGALVRPYLADVTRLHHPDLAVNDNSWAEKAQVYINARWLPGENPPSFGEPCVGMIGEEIAFIAIPASPCQEPLADWLEHCKATLPHVAAGGSIVDYLWDVVDRNGQAIAQDWGWFKNRATVAPHPQSAVIGPSEKFVAAAGAEVEPFVMADTRNGPVLIDQGAVVHSFTRLEGPCYIGRGANVLGAKIRAGTSLGPHSRVGGEVEASIVQGFSNKYHDGFLGHSYIGAWVNLAAGTQTSDLRNDYGNIRVHVAGQRINTGKNKIGSYIGDHSKTALGAILNTGSVIGAFSQILPSGNLSPQIIPSFCQVNFGQLQERWDLRQLFQTAATVMRRRGQELSDRHKDFYYSLYDVTARHRQRLLRESEYRRMRKSV